MDCKYESCHRRSNCRIKDTAHNCSIHRRYLKILNGENTPSDTYIGIDDERSIRIYVEEVKKKHPELAKAAEKNARDLFRSINY